MYRRIKKILIVPLLIVTLMSCIIYTDYRKPVQVEAAVLTGDPFVDIFSWALELVGFSPKNKENQAHALHEFSEWLVQHLRFSGTSIFNFPVRYCPVIERSHFIISSSVPAQITSPP